MDIHPGIQLIENCTSLSELSPSELSTILTLLIHTEQSPGGPYLLSSSRKQNIALNTRIYTLFADQGKYLTQTKNYLEHSDTSTPTGIVLNEKHLKSPLVKNAVHQDILSAHETVKARLTSLLSPELQKHIEPILEKVFAVDTKGELSMLSSLFQSQLVTPSLDDNTTQKIDAQAAGIANIYTWIAYSLYDRAIDNPENSLDIIGANILQREAYAIYRTAGINEKLISRSFNAVDIANSVEVLYCRAPITNNLLTITHMPSKTVLKRNLAAKSALHYLGPLAIARLSIPNPTQFKHHLYVFNSYCAVRQYSDDIHDWEDDLLHGHITYAVAHLLGAAKISSGTHNLKTIIPLLKNLYWESELSILLEECLSIAQTTAREYTKTFGFEDTSAFHEVTINPIIHATQQALAQHAFEKQFLKTIRF